MNADEVKHLLHEIQAQASGNAHTLDSETRAILTTLHAEIERLLSGSSPESEVARWKKALAKLEAAHPQLATVLGRVSEALSELGI